MVTKDIQAACRISTQEPVTQPEQQSEQTKAWQPSPSAEQPFNDASVLPIEIPQSLAEQPGFTLTWWPKFLAVYANQGHPFNAYEQTQVLGKLAEHPTKAVNILKNSVKTLTAHPELVKPGRRRTHSTERERPGENST